LCEREAWSLTPNKADKKVVCENKIGQKVQRKREERQLGDVYWVCATNG
jgi:hypothetical protein